MSMNRQWNNERNESRLQSFLKEMTYRGGVHGFRHAQRVENFGLLLARNNNADVDVVIWFAYLHDCQRTNDGADYNHGPEAARYIDTIRQSFLHELNDTQIGQLKEACRLHTSTRQTGDITVDTCFDADRLDLPRVGTRPEPKRMATEIGAEYAGREYDKNCKEANCNNPMGLQFHDRIIKTGKGESKFAVRFNEKTDDGKSVSPFWHSRGKLRGELHYTEWDLSAKSVSDSCGIRLLGCISGIYAVEYAEFISGKGYAAEIMRRNENVTILLLEYTDDDVVMRADEELCFSQCNIVYVSDQQTFIAKSKDGTLEKLMAQFIAEKDTAEYNTYAQNIRNIGLGMKMFAKDFNINTTGYDLFFVFANVLNHKENLEMHAAVVYWGCFIRLCGFGLDKFFAGRTRYMSLLYGDEIEMLESIFGNNAKDDDLRKARLRAFEDIAIIKNYLFTGKTGDLYYKPSKRMLQKFIEPVRQMCKEIARNFMSENYPRLSKLYSNKPILFDWQIASHKNC